MTSGQPKNRAAPKGPGNPLFELARTQLREGRFADAEATARRLVAAAPKSAETHILLAKALLQRGKPHDAVTGFRNALAIEPGNASTHYLLGCALRNAQRSAEAEFAFRDAIAANPGLADAHVDLGNLFLHQRQFAEAERAYRNAIAARPTWATGHYNLGNVLRESGRLDQAAAAYREALKHKPDYVEAWYNLGLAEEQAKRPAAAIAAYSKATDLRPGFADAHNNLGMLLKGLGRTDEAMAAFRRAIAAAPKHHLALCNLGNTLWDAQQRDEAISAYEACIAAAPSYIFPYINIACICREQHRMADAVQYARRAVAVDGRNARANAVLAGSLHALGEYDDAKAALAKTLALASDNADVLYELANACRDCGQLADAVDLYRRGCALRPGFAGAYNNLGLLLQELGDLAGAADAYRTAIGIAPRFGSAHGNLAQLIKYRAYDDQVRAMESLLHDPSLAPMERAAVMFGVAKAFDDLGDYDKAFEVLHAANRYKHGLLSPAIRNRPYDLNMKLIDLMTPSFFDRADEAGDPSTVPILIVGMPRSGTSLVEQIIASHSQVHGAGELIDLSRIFDDWVERVRAGTFPRRASEIPAEELRRRGSAYVAVLRRHSPDAPHITEKEPFNFRYVGFLRLVLPNAKIIHCMRDPVDTCMSSYKRLFGAGMAFSYDMQELGSYYNSYRQLMDHWRTVLPGVMFDIQYEDLVANQETKTRELLAYCGLKWEDRCLRFHETERAVRTPSFAQVRQPIYRTSVASSKKYYPYIRPLLETLGIDPDAPEA